MIAANPQIDSFAAQVGKYQQDGIAIPLPSITNTCGLSAENRAAISTDGVSVELMLNELIPKMGLDFYDATWAVPLADGGTVQFQTQKGTAAFKSWTLTRPGTGTAKAGMCTNP